MLSFVLAAACVVSLLYLAALRAGFRREVQRNPSRTPTPVSVVVAARNEETTLPHLIEALEQQDFADFEVLLIDDHSTDATRSLALAWAQRDGRVRVLSNAHTPGKKGAIRTGIEAAHHAWVLCTDADAVPHPSWVRRMAEAGAPDCIVLGFPRATTGGGFARFELLHTQLLAIGSCGLGKPFMAYGIAFGFPKALFHQAGGYAGWEELPGGDDDLLLHRMAELPGVEVHTALHPDAQVPTALPITLRHWLRQKRRHYADGMAYPARIMAPLSLYYISAFVLWLGATTGPVGVLLLGIRLVALAMRIREAGRVLGEPNLWLATPPLDGLLTLMNAFFGPISALFPPKKWEGRPKAGPISRLQQRLSERLQRIGAERSGGGA